MVDDTPQSGNATISADDVTSLNGGASSGVLVQRMKNGFGDDGTYRDVSSAFPLPVDLTASAGNVPQTSGTLTAALNTAVTASVGSMGNGTVVIYGGTFTSLPLVFEASVDGTNYFPIDVTRVDGYQIITSITLTAAGVYAYNFMCPGYTNVRVRVSATGAVTTAPSVIITQGPFLYDPSPSVAPLDGPKPTYVASVSGMSTTIAGDVFALTGSATRTIRVTSVEVSCTTGAATNSRIQLIKRTTADTGGTTSAAVVGSLDTTDAAQTATATGYTAAPTLGTAGPTVGNGPAFTSAAGSFSYSKTFGNRPAKAVVLRGTTQQLCVNNAVAIGTSGSWTITVEFTEE